MKIKATVASIMFCSVTYAALPFTNDTPANPCEPIRMQCKSNTISANDCMQQLEQCYQQLAQQRQQSTLEDTNSTEQTQIPQENILTDGQPEAPVDNGKTTPTTNPHPAWHFGN